MPGRGRPWPKGQSGNPAGKPTGGRDRVPRYTINDTIDRLVERYREGVAPATEEEITEMVKRWRAGVPPQDVLLEKLDEVCRTDAATFIATVAKVKDRADQMAPGAVTINYISNINPNALRNAGRTALPPEKKR